MMKKYFFFYALVMLSLSGLQAQESVSILPGYTQEAYYSFNSGLVAQVPNDNWDLAFQIEGFSAAIRVNAAKGLEVKQIPGLAPADWASVDTTGMDSWKPLYDSDSSWDIGALNQVANFSDQFDLGWGGYDVITHQVTASKIYLLKLVDGSYKKLMINNLIGGTYSFTYANLDGSNELTRELEKADFLGKNFGYYSFADDNVLDREPLSADWDLLFHRYYVDLGSIAYPVTGVWTNRGLNTAEVRGIAPTNASLSDTLAGFSAQQGSIGYDWKSYDLPTNAWILDDSLSFFIQKNEDTYYHLAFTGFGGGGTGDFLFTLNSLTTGLESLYQPLNLSVFPNPTQGNLRIRLQEPLQAVAKLQLMDLQGRSIQQQTLNVTEQDIQLDLSALPAGLYLLSIEQANQRWVQSVVKQ